MIVYVANALLIMAGLMFAGASTQGPQNAFPIWGCMFLVLAFVVTVMAVRHYQND